MARKGNQDAVVRSIIGQETVLEGTFYTKETTRINGTVKGTIQSEGTLIIGQGGKIVGNINAVNILVAGEVNGELYATGKIEASATARIFGDIKTKSLIIDENAVFQGSCVMDVQEQPMEETKKKGKSSGKPYIEVEELN